MSLCLACAANLPKECYLPGGEQCQPPSNHSGILVPATRSGPYKEDEDVTDPKSTGRKRAAKMYPLTEGLKCEWSGLKFAGGGVVPIIGCHSGNAVARHHGPDKNTLNNSEGNVHRTCVFCHNRWHTANDPHYTKQIDETQTWVPNKDWVPHNPETKATIVEIFKNEAYWGSTKTIKAKD